MYLTVNRSQQKLFHRLRLLILRRFIMISQTLFNFGTIIKLLQYLYHVKIAIISRQIALNNNNIYMSSKLHRHRVGTEKREPNYTIQTPKYEQLGHKGYPPNYIPLRGSKRLLPLFERHRRSFSGLDKGNEFGVCRLKCVGCVWVCIEGSALYNLQLGAY